jgi:hypothetical protein
VVSRGRVVIDGETSDEVGEGLVRVFHNRSIVRMALAVSVAC